ncbi:Holliday junction resolvase RuvX [Parendozoicomonas haliclonae]|uniref:Putative pre-16S rRNA nuclease n=2 Tax=Parendozoicomonas haliclonae TaxID=1960125 RepID=A0A1X7AJ24_9GAMM|nr:putative Holliday junction resolvase [Parendozoicomonas haliclonae]
MGFDFGTRNIGIAMGQAVTQTANAISPIKARDGIPNWEELERIVEEWNPDAFVVGIPLNMDGTESDMSRRARKFANRLMARFNRAWHPVDERLTSFEAKEWAGRLGHKGHYGSNPVDAMAAQLLLESWMNGEGAELLAVN